MPNNPTDPDYLMKAATNAALERLIMNPAVDPIIPPPPEGEQQQVSMRQISAPSSSQSGSTGDAPISPAITQQYTPPSQPAEPVVQLSEEKLTPEVQEAMTVLENEEIVEKVDENTWRVI